MKFLALIVALVCVVLSVFLHILGDIDTAILMVCWAILLRLLAGDPPHA